MTRFLWQNLPNYQAPDQPAPSPEPAPEPSPAPTNPLPPIGGDNVLGDSSEFMQLGEPDDEGSDDVLEPAVPAVEGEPPEGSPVAKPPKATPAAVDPKTAKPAVVPPAAPTEPAPAQPVASVAQPSAAPAPAEPQSLVQQLDQHREAVIDGLAAERFQLTKEEADALELDATKAIPRLMAKTYYSATQSALLHIQNFVPQMVVQMVRAMREQEKAEDAFYAAHTHLDRGKHAADVNQFSQLFRTSNPQLPQNDLLAMVAAATMAKHGIVPGAAVGVQPNGGKPAASAPQPRIPPFVPARPGVGVRVSPEQESPFAGLGRDFED